MATTAQITANRANAQKSTGPRTPEGKALVARNAVKHGLLGEQIVVEGEDRERFTQHRDKMLRALIPIGEVESTLAERLIGLSWRLQRIERLQVQAFEALCAGPVEDSAGEGADELTLGRIVVKDFAETRVLDRLLMYERRIEHSLCRVLGQLRRERLFQDQEARTQDDGNPQVLLERFMREMGSDSPTAVLHLEPGSARWEEPGAQEAPAEDAEELWEKVVSGEYDIPSGSPAREPSPHTLATPEESLGGTAGLPHVAERVGQAATNGTETAAPACEAHPVGEDSGSPRSTCSGRAPARQALAAGFLRQTNPIGVAGETGQVLAGAGVTDDSAPEGREETKPISPAVGACRPT